VRPPLARRWSRLATIRQSREIEGDPTTSDSKSEDGDEWLQSYTIITTKPIELTATVHNRMPVILHPDDYEEWLMRVDGESPPTNLLHPFPADEMEAKESLPKFCIACLID
jgi:putative SOS response-associated peptidase YedK